MAPPSPFASMASTFVFDPEDIPAVQYKPKDWLQTRREKWVNKVLKGQLELKRTTSVSAFHISKYSTEKEKNIDRVSRHYAGILMSARKMCKFSTLVDVFEYDVSD